jgi:hypothetical protein
VAVEQLKSDKQIIAMRAMRVLKVPPVRYFIYRIQLYSQYYDFPLMMSIKNVGQRKEDTAQVN